MPNNFNVPSNWRGALPFNLYVKLQKRFPQQAFESDALWLRRIGKNSIVWDAKFREDLEGVLYRKRLDQAGLTRVEEIGKAGTGGQRSDFRNKQYNVKDLTTTRAAQTQQAKTYMTGPNSPSPAEQDRHAFEKLVTEFQGKTPVNGSIFWNGVSATKLAQCVAEWNQLPGVHVGQLEATTSFRWANGHFVYKWGNEFAKLTSEVSEKLGAAASGHMTAVVMCGLRDNSVLTLTEFPKILEQMAADLKMKKTPRVTDISLVILEPRHDLSAGVVVLTNSQIKQAKIIKTAPGKFAINCREDSVEVMNFESGAGLKIPWQVSDYWSKRPLTESIAAQKIKNDFPKFYYGKSAMWTQKEILR